MKFVISRIRDCLDLPTIVFCALSIELNGIVFHEFGQLFASRDQPKSAQISSNFFRKPRGALICLHFKNKAKNIEKWAKKVKLKNL